MLRAKGNHSKNLSLTMNTKFMFRKIAVVVDIVDKA